MGANRWLRLRTAAVPVAVAVLLAACGGSGDSAGGAAAPTAPAAPAPGTGGTDETPERGGTLRMAWTAVPNDVNPSTFGGIVTQKLSQNYMETLVRYDGSGATPGAALGLGDIVPNLARSIEPVENGYRITLHEGVLSPYGNELTTADVAWSFERTAALDFVAGIVLGAGNMDFENPITVIDEYTFTYNTTGPSALGTAVLHWHGTGIYDSTEVKRHATADDPWAAEWLLTNSASFGPYTVSSVEPGVEIRLVANTNYWQGLPQWDEVIVRAIPEASSRVQLLIAGEVDVILEVPYDQIATLEGAANTVVYAAPDTNRDTLILNNRLDIFQDPRVRSAISFAINRDAIVSSVYEGRVSPALSGLSSALVHPEPDNLVSYDPARARELLSEAGVSNLTFTVAINSSRPGPVAEPLARLIQSDLAAVGITMNIRSIPALADFEGAVRERNLEAWLYTERPTLADAGYSFNLYNRTGGFVNNQGYSNPELDEMIVEILAAPQGPARDAVIKRATELVLRETPIVYLVETRDVVATSDAICCYVGYPDGAPLFNELRRTR